MDRNLAQQLRAINGDRHSGAAELALRAVHALRSWLKRHPHPPQRELLDVARVLCRTQSMMAPFRRLANEVALASDTDHSGAFLRRSLTAIQWTARYGPHRIASVFQNVLEEGAPVTVVTFSYSSTVLRSLIAARRSVRTAYVSLASPENEGRAMAVRLAEAGVHTCLTTDVDLPGLLNRKAHTILVVGADQVRERDFINRAGTELLVECSSRLSIPCWVLADRTKFVSGKGMFMADRQEGWTDTLLAKPIRNLQVCRAVLAPSPLRSNVRVLNEQAWLTPRQVRSEIEKIVVSPRLKELVG